jgi:3-hydroxyisobutyrate dehydrogenase-like beta-hydroxyacid dehydrogenase
MLFGFLGLGNMGGVLARNMVQAGEQVMVFSRRIDHAKSFTGALVAETIRDLMQCDVLCTCLPLPEHVLDAVLGEQGLYTGMKAGAIHIEFSTIDPATAHRMEQEAHHKGMAYVQATVGKTPQMAAQKAEPLFVGGDRNAIEIVMPILEKIGKPRDVGTIDASCAIKLLSNLIGMANLAVLAEGMRLGTLAGIDSTQLVELLQDTGARSFQLDVRGPWIAQGDYEARFGVNLAAKDMRLGCAMAHAWGYSPRMMEQACDYYHKANQSGLGAEDCAAVFKVTSER